MKISNFLAEQLDKISKSEGFLEYVIEQESGSQHGEGFVATMVAVTLVGKRKIGNEVTTSQLELMCKCMPENLLRREAMDSSIIFQNEAYIYNEVFPAFDRFQRDKNIPIEDRFTEYPKCYAAVRDVESDEQVIVMENLKATGYGLWDKSKPIDYETVCLHMNALGKLHALSFALRDQKPELFDEISNFNDILLEILEKNENPFIRMMESACEETLSLLDHPDEVKVIQSFKDNVKDECMRMLDKELAGRFYVIGHGDSWNNNLFYSNEGETKPQKICLLDWQISRCGSPGLDIAYYLMTSTNKQVRERYEDLLRVYHNSLSNLMRKLGTDPNKWLTFDDLLDQMKTVGRYGVLRAPCVLQILVADPENIVNMDNITTDATELTEIATLDESSLRIFKERISDVIRDAIRFGWV